MHRPLYFIGSSTHYIACANKEIENSVETLKLQLNGLRVNLRAWLYQYCHQTVEEFQLQSSKMLIAASGGLVQFICDIIQILWECVTASMTCTKVPLQIKEHVARSGVFIYVSASLYSQCF